MPDAWQEVLERHAPERVGYRDLVEGVNEIAFAIPSVLPGTALHKPRADFLDQRPGASRGLPDREARMFRRVDWLQKKYGWLLIISGETRLHDCVSHPNSQPLLEDGAICLRIGIFAYGGVMGMAMMLTLLVACLLIYKLDLPEWLYLLAIGVSAIEAGAWGFRRRAEEREFAFIHDKLTAIDSRIGELSVSVGR